MSKNQALGRLTPIHVFLFAGGIHLAACRGIGDGPPSRAECEQATLHAIALRVASAALTSSVSAQERHREQLAGAVGNSMIADCESTFARERYDCVTRARSASELDACGPNALADEEGGAR